MRSTTLQGSHLNTVKPLRSPLGGTGASSRMDAAHFSQVGGDTIGSMV
jgi:hypothetical protein